MRMNANTHLAATAKVAAEIFNLIGIHIRRIHFNGRGQVDYHRALGARLPDFGHCLTNFQRKFWLGKAERFRGVLVLPARLWIFFAKLSDQTRGPGCERNNLRLVHAKNQAAKQRGGGVIQMKGRLFRTAQRFKGAKNQLVPRLS
ncbi:hypothetical protein D3C86_1648610 [compost metagenome]